jgi:hypothetical protein
MISSIRERIGLGLSGLVIIGGVRRRKGIWQSAILLIVVVIGLTMAGCGGDHVINPTTGTPAGTYTVTVNAASGNTSHSGTITLFVQ